jgi:hypothetical protein
MLPDRPLLRLVLCHFWIDKKTWKVLGFSFGDHWFLFCFLTAWKVVHFVIFDSLVNKGLFFIDERCKVAKFFFKIGIKTRLLFGLIVPILGSERNGRKTILIELGILFVKNGWAEFKRYFLVIVFDIFLRRKYLICRIKLNINAVQHFLGMKSF